MKITNASIICSIGVALSAQLGTAAVFTLGIDDGTQGEFSQENGPQAAPGSPTVFDDDYYFAGTYPAPIGTVSTDEVWTNLDRAIANNDPTNRLHFNLTGADVAAASYTLTLDLIGLGWWDAAAAAAGQGQGTHDVTATFNGNTVFSQTGITADTLATPTFSPASVGAVVGANVIEITRTGGDSAGDGSGVGWIQFDYVQLDANPIPEPSSALLFLLGGMAMMRRRRR